MAYQVALSVKGSSSNKRTLMDNTYNDFKDAWTMYCAIERELTNHLRGKDWDGFFHHNKVNEMQGSSCVVRPQTIDGEVLVYDFEIRKK